MPRLTPRAPEAPSELVTSTSVWFARASSRFLQLGRVNSWTAQPWLSHRSVNTSMRSGLDSGHTEEEGCWEYHRAAKLPVAEAGLDAETDIQTGSLRGDSEA